MSSASMPPTNSFSDFPKGSEWRRWDLQTATIVDDDYVPLKTYADELKQTKPSEWQQYTTKVGGEASALLYDSAAHFNDSTIDKKLRCTNYVRNLFAFLDVFSPELACLGITDHNYFDDQLLDTLIDYSQKSRCKVIPGVEVNCQGIHMLLFFPQKLYEKPTFSAGIQAFLMKFNINNRTNSDGVLTTTTADIKKIIDEAKECGGLIIYPHCNSDNGLFQERTKTDRTHLADIFNHQKINLLQSQHHDAAVEVSEYIKKNGTLTPKACSHISSDARSLRDYGRGDKDGNYLWIKADPTFEGLKQILYEPEQRVYVGPQKPDEKKSYFVIDKVRFLDNTIGNRFASTEIEINENLTTIIGGKSTGKSLLLYYIAKTIDPEEVTHRTDNGRLVTYDVDTSLDFNFEVTWKDGQRSLLKVAAGAAPEESRKRKILYIPQRYLNTLSEANIKSKEALNEFVLNVILQDEATRETYEKANGQIKLALQAIASEIAKLFAEREDISRTEEELKQIGDERGIAAYIATLQERADAIKAQSGMTEAQSQKYEALVATEKTIAEQLSTLDEDKKTVTKLRAAALEQLNEVRATVDEHGRYLNDIDVKAAFEAEMKVVDHFAQTIETSTSKLVGAIEAKVGALNTQLGTAKSELAPLLAMVKLQSELQVKTDAIKAEQHKLTEIGIKNHSLKTKRESFKKNADAIIETYKQIAAKYEHLRNECKKFESKFGEISLSVVVAFNEEQFNTGVVREYVNRTDLKRAIPETEWDEEFVYRYDPQKHFANVQRVFDGLIGGTIKTVKNRQARDAISKLLENYFYLDFRISYRSDALDKMSPGKKGLVLLQLLINLSNEEWPILLDQPEDDLDNRSVYDDLVKFLKEKKGRRQMIIVTHNPNLVVGADAEEVIVANQSGQEIGRDNRKYQFEYVSGALENSYELDAAKEPAILFRKGIRQHGCEILEGGKEAFQKREQKYDFPQQ
jgi:predicted ATPase